jgi:hypothetical protein
VGGEDDDLEVVSLMMDDYAPLTLSLYPIYSFFYE